MNKRIQHHLQLLSSSTTLTSSSKRSNGPFINVIILTIITIGIISINFVQIHSFTYHNNNNNMMYYQRSNSLKLHMMLQRQYTKRKLLDQIKRLNPLKSSFNSRPITTTTTTTTTAIKMNHNNNNNDDDDEISFSWESFDKKGEWLTIDYDNIPIEKPKSFENSSSHHHQNTSTSNNNNNNNTNMKQIFAPMNASPIETKLIENKKVYIKRDDLLHLRNSNVSGNKARKMLALNELDVSQFPDVVVSYGGPQSNAMLALAAIVHAKNEILNDKRLGLEGGSIDYNDVNGDNEIESDSWIMSDDEEDNIEDNNNIDDDEDNNIEEENDDDEFDHITNQSSSSSSASLKRFVYYTKKLPRYLKNQPNGNLLRALTLGMELIQLKPDDYNDYFGGDDGGSSIAPIDAPVPGSSLWVPQGCACGLATQGAKFMAEEIVSFWNDEGKGMPLSVIVPGGTCTTAMLLSREINVLVKEKIGTEESEEDMNLDIEVVVVPCVGDATYAFRQMRALDLSTGGNGRDDIPIILQPLKRKGYFRFGEPDAKILETFTKMKDEYDVYLDLLYGAPAWNIILQHWEIAKYGSNSDESPLKGRQIMYVHSGGLEGVSSQLTRYKHKGLVDSGQVQS